MIDLRSLAPLDMDTIQASVRKTRRAVVVHEAPVFMGLGAEIAARVMHDLFDVLAAPVERVGSPTTPYPPARVEKLFLPDADRILEAVDRTRSIRRRVCLYCDESVATMSQFLLPDLGEGLEEAQLVQWLVQVGDCYPPQPADLPGRDRQGAGRHSVALCWHGAQPPRAAWRYRAGWHPLITIATRAEEAIASARPPPTAEHPAVLVGYGSAGLAAYVRATAPAALTSAGRRSGRTLRSAPTFRLPLAEPSRGRPARWCARLPRSVASTSRSIQRYRSRRTHPRRRSGGCASACG